MREDAGFEEAAEEGGVVGAFVDTGDGDGELGVVHLGEDDVEAVGEGVGEEEEGGRVLCFRY